ncbi:unnamed protein product, partial [Prorocentrum cordatum]
PSGPRRASTLSLLAGPGAPRGGRAPPPPCPPSLVSLDRGGLAPCCCRVAQGASSGAEKKGRAPGPMPQQLPPLLDGRPTGGGAALASGGGLAPAATELLSDADAAGFQRMLGALEEVHFRARLRAFVGEHCVGFAHAGSLEADGLGHPLEWTALHRQYQELFDAQLEGFLAAEGVPREAFVALARSLSRARADYRTGWDAFLAEITASSDYGGFVALMRAAAEARRAEEFEASMSVEMAEVARDPAPDPRG